MAWGGGGISQEVFMSQLDKHLSDLEIADPTQGPWPFEVPASCGFGSCAREVLDSWEVVMLSWSC